MDLNGLCHAFQCRSQIRAQRRVAVLDQHVSVAQGGSKPSCVLAMGGDATVLPLDAPSSNTSMVEQSDHAGSDGPSRTSIVSVSWFLKRVDCTRNPRPSRCSPTRKPASTTIEKCGVETSCSIANEQNCRSLTPPSIDLAQKSAVTSAAAITSWDIAMRCYASRISSAAAPGRLMPLLHTAGTRPSIADLLASGCFRGGTAHPRRRVAGDARP